MLQSSVHKKVYEQATRFKRQDTHEVWQAAGFESKCGRAAERQKQKNS
jgi:hypothetical protein